MPLVTHFDCIWNPTRDDIDCDQLCDNITMVLCQYRHHYQIVRSAKIIAEVPGIGCLQIYFDKKEYELALMITEYQQVLHMKSHFLGFFMFLPIYRGLYTLTQDTCILHAIGVS